MLSTGDLVIERFDTNHDSGITCCPFRGGIVISLILNGKEVLYFDPASIVQGAPIRGGIPILFPNAGVSETLPRHGFARDSSNWNFEKTEMGFVQTLVANDETKKIYPYDFVLTLAARFESPDTGTFIQTVTNHELQKSLPVAMGLHPYFPVPDAEKRNVQFYNSDGALIETHFELWNNGDTTVIDNPGILDIKIPSLGMLHMEISAEYKKIWIWSAPGSSYVCIEPMMRDIGGFDDNPRMVLPQEKISAHFSITLK